MAIRKQLNPRQMDISPELRDLLMRNGMQAHIIADGNGYQLAHIQTHREANACIDRLGNQLCQQDSL